MEKREIYEKLETLKLEYMAMEKKYREYAKCVEQYDLFLERMYNFVCRLLVDKNYNVANGEVYFKENQEFAFEISPQEFVIDLCEIVNEFLKQKEIGSLAISPSTDNLKPVVLIIKFNSSKKINELERELNSLRNENKKEKVITR